MKDQGEWLKQLGELQQQYWNGWREMSSQAMPQPQPSSPWQGGLDAWTRAMGMPAGGGMPGFGAPPAMAGGDVMQRLLSHSRQYLDLLQSMGTGRGFSAGPQFDPRAWIDEMREMHERFGQGLLGNVAALPWFGGIDAGQIEQLVKQFTAVPARGMQQEIDGWLSLPTFGLAREHQERSQDLLRAWMDHQLARARYDELMLKSTTRTFDLLESNLAEREAAGRQIETARGLYDLWIDAAEEAFAEVAMSADYQSLYGDLINTQMRVRAGLNGEIERLGAQFGLPTRTEVDSLARQVHELKRELRRRASNDVRSSTPERADKPAADQPRPGAPAARQRKRSASERTTAKPSRKSAGKKGGSKTAAAAVPAKGGPAIQSTAAKSARRR